MFDLPHNLGDYTLTELTGSDSCRYTYLAEQKGTGRQVILELFNQSEAAPGESERFLDEVRAKTRVSEHLSQLGLVYEAQNRDGFLFYTYQKPEGRSLSQIVSEQGTLSSAEILSIVDFISVAAAGFGELGVPVRPFSLDDLMVRDNWRIAMNNPALGGARPDDFDREYAAGTARLLLPLVTPGTPGATRLQTLFDWMINGAEGQRLAWGQIHELVVTVQEQLGLLSPSDAVVRSGSGRKRRIVLIAVVLGVLAVVAASFFLYEPAPVIPDDSPKKPVLTPRAEHMDVLIVPSSGGEPFLCDAYEVTIKAYKRFLDSLGRLPAASVMTAFAHPDQPETKQSYVPDDWDAILAAAEARTEWEGMALTMDSPVFNVDWWDACAYAKWKNRRLPTRDEWMEAASRLPAETKGDPYGPVADYSNDFGPDNLCGFASGVSEWTDTLEKNPAQPMEPAQHLICGGDYRNPGLKAVRHEPDPGYRSRTTGFRTVQTQQQQED